MIQVAFIYKNKRFFFNTIVENNFWFIKENGEKITQAESIKYVDDPHISEEERVRRGKEISTLQHKNQFFCIHAHCYNFTIDEKIVDRFFVGSVLDSIIMNIIKPEFQTDNLDAMLQKFQEITINVFNDIFKFAKDYGNTEG